MRFRSHVNIPRCCWLRIINGAPVFASPNIKLWTRAISHTPIHFHLSSRSKWAHVSHVSLFLLCCQFVNLVQIPFSYIKPCECVMCREAFGNRVTQVVSYYVELLFIWRLKCFYVMNLTTIPILFIQPLVRMQRHAAFGPGLHEWPRLSH